MSLLSFITAAGSAGAGGAGLDVDEVFSTDLWDGTGGSLTINNGLDLDGEGGLTWIKGRTINEYNNLFDTERGDGYILRSSITSGNNGPFFNQAFTSTGFSLNSSDSQLNSTSHDYVSWSFRKAPKFFDVVTWTGNGVNNRSISHNLGSKPGAIIMKRTDGTENWYVGCWNGMPHNNGWKLNTNETTSTYGYFGTTAPTSTTFNVTHFTGGNQNGYTYVAYLFAHNNNDGEFGPDSDQDIIKCGSFTTSSSSATNVEIDIGFEPQWLLLKTTSVDAPWNIVDNMRGFTVDGTSPRLSADSVNSESEGASNRINIRSNGFSVNSTQYGTSEPMIYMAIRRGPLAEPTSASDVFAVDTAHSDNNNTVSGDMFTAGFPVDMGIYARRSSSSFPNIISARLTQGASLYTNATDAENTSTDFSFDHQTGWSSGSTTITTDKISWMWKRAPGYFDVVCYTGNYTDGRTITHNLGVAPEMIWVKLRDTYSAEWMVFHKDLATNHNLQLDSTAASADYSGRIRSPTATTFTVGNDTSVNRQSPLTYIAYLFATVAGVSKVGSFTGAGSDVTVDCGFSNGAKFVIIKDADASDDWYVYDTVRGIVAGNDGYLELNTTNAENTGADYIDPHSSGFIITSGFMQSGRTYIFYAVAA